MVVVDHVDEHAIPVLHQFRRAKVGDRRVACKRAPGSIGEEAPDFRSAHSSSQVKDSAACWRVPAGAVAGRWAPLLAPARGAGGLVWGRAEYSACNPCR